MRRLRISIAGLLGLVAFTGVSIAALIHPSPLAGHAFYSLTLSILIIAVLAAVYHRGMRRAFWVGFSTSGWAYFLAVFGPAPISQVGQNLVTTTILHIVYPYTLPSELRAAILEPVRTERLLTRLVQSRVRTGGTRVVLTGGFGVAKAGPAAPPPTPWEIWTKPDRTGRFNRSSPRMYQWIGHSLFCLAFATLGGFLTRRFRATRDHGAPATT